MSDALKRRVLVVEDEASFVDAMRVGLTREGFQVQVALDGVRALELFRAQEPDLVILDLMLPKMSGIDVCREIRKVSSVPIIMVTARDSETDTVVGLEIGADDYVTKPFRLRELIARMRAVLRRAEGDEVDREHEVVSAGGIQLDIARHVVTVRGDEVELPLKEFEVLALLLANAGRVVRRETLIDRVWGHDYVGDTKTLDVHIRRLRSKLEGDRSEPDRIVTVRGVGYRFEPADR